MRQFPRRQIAEESRDLQREQEILSKPVNLSGEGEDPVVREALQRLVTAPNDEALEIALHLQQLIRGKASILENPELHAEIPKLREDLAKAEAVNASYERDREKFLETVFGHADKIRPVGDRRDRIIATGVQQYQEISKNAEANRITKQLKLDQILKSQPKEEIEVVGRMETIRAADGSVKAQMSPIVVRIMHRTFVLTPGKHVVPKMVADLYRQKARGIELQAKRKEALALDAGHTTTQVNNIMKKLDKEYATTSEFSKPGGV